jgi:hypothetical protein
MRELQHQRVDVAFTLQTCNIQFETQADLSIILGLARAVSR